MEKIFEARTEQEAVEKAVRQLGVNEEFIEVEVLQKSKNSLFGRNSKVTIKATVIGLPNAEEKPPSEHDDDSSYDSEPYTTRYSVDDTPKTILPQDIQEQCCATIQELVAHIGIKVDCTYALEDNFHTISLHSDEEKEQNLLIGKYGKNIEALQNITNAILRGSLSNFEEKLVLDVEKYRKKRAEWLNNIAHKKADYVLRTGKSYLLEELGPFDRKLVHTIIRDVDGVSTISKGNGYYKRVEIHLD